MTPSIEEKIVEAELHMNAKTASEKPVRRRRRTMGFQQGCQIIFTADRDLKKRTMKKTKQNGITLKALFIFCMKAFLQNKIRVSVIGSPFLPLSRGVKIFRTEEEKTQAQAAKLIRLVRDRYKPDDSAKLS